MVTKLKLLLQKLHLLLALKALIFGALLWFVKASGFSWLALFLFVGVAVVIYARHLFQTLKFGYAFLLLLGTALLFVYRLPSAYLWLGCVYFGLAWLLLLGVKDVEFVHRDQAYALFNCGILYAVLLLFFTSNPATLFVPRLIGLGLVVSFLFGQILKFRRPVTNVTLAFVFIQLVWGISLLPIGFMQAANAGFIIAVAMIDFTLLHFKNLLTRNLVIKKLALYGALVLLIFLTSKWTLTP